MKCRCGDEMRPVEEQRGKLIYRCQNLQCGETATDLNCENDDHDFDGEDLSDIISDDEDDDDDYLD